MIGMIASLERQAAMSVTSPAKKLFIYPTYYEGGDCNKHLICTGQLPNQQIDPMVPYLVENIGKTIYVIGHGLHLAARQHRRGEDGVEAARRLGGRCRFLPLRHAGFRPGFREGEGGQARYRVADPGRRAMR